MAKIPQTVAEAAQALDSVDPNWWFRIDLSTFTQDDCTRCVLGQSQPDGFWKAIDRLFGSGAKYLTLGPFGNSKEFAPDLDHQWRKEIEYRRKPGTIGAPIEQWAIISDTLRGNPNGGKFFSSESRAYEEAERLAAKYVGEHFSIARVMGKVVGKVVIDRKTV